MSNNEPTFPRFMHNLNAIGIQHSPKLAAAFRDIPREHFVPYFFVQRPGIPGWEVVEKPSDEWRDTVSRDEALITQIDGTDDNYQAAQKEKIDGVPTSSSSAPSLMASMLLALGAHSGQRVLEIGTGTGYNAALLCRQIGDSAVTTVDIDTGLVERARNRLTDIGYFPRVEVADGTTGCPERAPFDRIIATVAMNYVPDSLLQQVTPGGKILTPFNFAGRGGLMALLTVERDGSAEGNFLPFFGGFMPLRAQQYSTQSAMFTTQDHEGELTFTQTPVGTVTDPASRFEFFAALAVGGFGILGFTPNNGGATETWLTHTDGSWACHTTHPGGTYTVRQGGQARLWDRLEHAHLRWQQLGEPTRDRFGLSVRGGQHIVWLDHPASADRWPLHAPTPPAPPGRP